MVRLFYLLSFPFKFKNVTICNKPLAFMYILNCIYHCFKFSAWYSLILRSWTGVDDNFSFVFGACNCRRVKILCIWLIGSRLYDFFLARLWNLSTATFPLTLNQYFCLTLCCRDALKKTTSFEVFNFCLLTLLETVCSLPTIKYIYTIFLTFII